jgi:hypothetical protein
MDAHPPPRKNSGEDEGKTRRESACLSFVVPSNRHIIVFADKCLAVQYRFCGGWVKMMRIY